ncbi:SAC3/GANP/Nin1/mts3/eIF-3 p25 family-domain-containing protein [Pyrenochaeta sp. MPI-SDFR-AT-0127]|nr:SAC3/GANP/Nin1/mts3/eIF-3 p25 family-domain-containing protein [Pyrenochaeta sp. MPI-SDFR-AT-0127]
MSTPPRGGRGGGDRGRGGRGGSAPNRGAGGRGRGNGPAQHNSDRPAQGLYTPRGAGQRGQRGGALRGSANTRGARGNTHGRGGNTNVFTSNTTGAQNTTQYAPEDYKKRLERIKAARPLQREQFIQQGLMNPEGQMRLSDSVKLIGICTDMCPEFERVRRIVENDVKPPECTPETEHLTRANRIPDESRMVKAYARSAAGMDVELVSEMRSPAACLKTIDYLFERLDNDEFQFLQSWIWDRTRAVRKDLRTQRIESKPDINILLTCLERTARFHLLSMHHMAQSTKEDYTHQQDMEQLNQTMMSLRERYTDNRRASIPSENEAEFWAYRLILAPQYATNQFENELHRLPSDLRHNIRVKTAIEIFRLLKSVLIGDTKSFVQCQANWKKLWELVKSPKVSYLMACAAEVSFNRVRHIVLDCIWRAYRQGNTKRTIVVEDWTTDKLKEVLGLDTDQEAVKLCEDFGFEFSLNAAGQTFLDISKKGYANQVLPKPIETKPQTFSASLVEFKRHDRALSAVIQGMSVPQARANGYLVYTEDMEYGEEMGDENSLFVPEAPTPNVNIFNQRPIGIGTPSSIGTPTLNPVASPFQPSSTPAATSNPFLKAASQLQPTAATPTFTTPGIQPGVFDASKAPIQFALPGGATTTSVSKPSDAPSKPVNPFLRGAPAPSTPQSNPFVPASSAPQSNPFAKFAASKSEQPVATPPPAATPLKFPGVAPNGNLPQIGTPPGLSFTPTGPPPQEAVAAEDESRQKVEQERREAAEKEKREAEARQRAQEAIQEAQRARAAQEAEQRRKQAEAEAEAERQRRQLQADRERQAREEQERRIRDERRRQAQEEEARIARIRERQSALHSLTADIMFHPDDGLMIQFIENAAHNIVQEVIVEEQKRRQEELRAEQREQQRLLLARAVIARWIGIIQKRKRTEQTRNRRRRIKEQRARLANLEQIDSGDAPTPTVDQLNNKSTFQRPAAPASARRARRTEERHGGTVPLQERTSERTMAPNGSRRTTGAPDTSTSAHLTNGDTSITSYSHSYQQSTAPIDRTETDWFKLRAMGIDPSKIRKRSFDSNSDEEEQLSIEPKRPKLSPPTTEGHELPPPTTIPAEDQLARFRAIQQAFRKSGSSPPQLVNGANSINGRSSVDSSSIITKARELIANSPTPKAALSRPSALLGTPSINGTTTSKGNSSSLIAKARKLVSNTTAQQHSPPNSQHDWGRSVPNLGFAASTNSRSAFGKSTGAVNTIDRPAYWGRASRFVPRHLYGKGPEAIRAYNDQYVKKSPSSSTRLESTEPFAQSSPIPIQHSYFPQQGFAQQDFTQEQYSEEEDVSGVELVDADMEDENAIMTDEDEVEEQEHYGSNGNQQYLSQRPSQPQFQDEDEDSEMADTEEDTEDEDEGFIKKPWEEVQCEEVYEDYDEYTEDEEGSSPQPQYAPSTKQQFVQPSTQQFEKPGATEDDAIELSD